MIITLFEKKLIMDKERKLISKEKMLETLKAYFSWKETSSQVKGLNGRGVNLPEAISERIVCYVNGFSLATGEGSYDALSSDGKTIQIKATSRFYNDLTSFGPQSEFEDLHFARFNLDKDEVWLYDIASKDLGLDDIVLGKKKNETFSQQQDQKRRPRFSIIKEFIEKYHLEPYKKVNLRELYKNLSDEKV